MSTQTGVVTKQEASSRLIVSAVRLLDQAGDSLAIHVLAASALNLLRERMQHEGSSYVAMVFRSAIYQAALAKHHGKPRALQSEPTVDPLVEKVYCGIRDGSIQTEDDFEVSLTVEEERRVLQFLTKPFNFSKHSKRDPNAEISEGDVKPVEAIIHAVTAHSFLFPTEALPMEVEKFLRDQEVLG